MEFHQIRYFLAACDHMNFTRAAEACHVSQPALTVAVRKLEEELGGPLFQRDGGRIQLTDLGRAMRTHLARIQETREIARQAAREFLDAPRQEVALGVYSTIGPRSICGAIGAFRDQAPDIRLVLHDVWGPKAYDLLIAGAFDCALVARHTPLPPRLTATPLFIEPMVLAMAQDHPLARAEVVHAADLAGQTYFDRLRCEFRQEIQAELKQRGVAVDTAMRSEPEAWVLSAVAAGRGVTILPRDQAVAPGVVAAPVQDLRYDRVIELVTVTGRALSEPADRFVAYMSGIDWTALA